MSIAKSFVIVLFANFVLFTFVIAQCYIDSNISIYQSGYPGQQFQESNNQCLANYTVISASIIDGNASKGITCSRKDSTATDGTWSLDGTAVNCSNTTGLVRCTRQQPGSVTLFTAGPYHNGGDDDVPEGNYTCCIEGLCTSIRLYQFATVGDMYPFSNSETDSQLESCSIIPPSDITAIPQQYMVQMVTSEVPPSRLASFIECSGGCGDGVTLGESYYTLVNLTAERYQFTVPVTWSADSNNNTVQNYKCRLWIGGLDDDGDGKFIVIVGKEKNTEVSSSNAPIDVIYNAINATAVIISWDISGNVSGFIINITYSDEIHTITANSSEREFVVNGLLPEVDYTVEVRGYYELLGPATTTTVKLEAGINSVDGSLLSVSDDQSTQLIHMNCYTFRVEPNQVTWRIGSELITPDSSYQPVNNSELLDSVDQIYRHNITLNGSFIAEINVSCSINVNGVTSSKNYQLRAGSEPPNIVSATILSTTSLSISWISVSGVSGYIVNYNGGQPALIDGESSMHHELIGLIKGNEYTIEVYSYSEIISEKFSALTILFDVPLIILFEVEPNNATSIMLSWNTLNSSVVDNYTVTVTNLCLNVDLRGINGTQTSLLISSLLRGFRYSISITPINILGEGMERTETATLQGNGPPSGAPLLLPPVVINSTAVRLLWEEVNCTERNGVITGYSIQYSSDEEVPTINVTTTDITSTIITGLTNFMLYSFSVAAVNNKGIGPYSNKYKVYTVNTQVFNLLLIASTQFVLLSWEPPMNNGFNITFEYEVVYSIDSKCYNQIALHTEYTVYSPNATNTSTEVFGLMSSTCYRFGVRAYSSSFNTSGDFSIISGATVGSNLNFSIQASIRSAQLTWSTLPAVSIDEYVYEVGYSLITNNCTGINQTSLSSNYTSFLNTTVGSAEVTGLKANTCYVFGVRVYSTRAGQPGEWNIKFRSTLPQGVTNLSSSDHQLTSVTLTWLPLGIETDVMFIYQVGYSARHDDTQCTDNSISTLPDEYTLFDNTTDTSIVVTGLEPGTCYVFGVRVHLCKSNESGEWTIVLQKTQTQEVKMSSMHNNNIRFIAGGLAVGVTLIVIVIVIILLSTCLALRRSKLGNSAKQAHYEQKSELTDFKVNEDSTLYVNVGTTIETVADGNNAYEALDYLSELATGDPECDATDVLPSRNVIGSDCPMIPEILPISEDDLGKYVLGCHTSGNEEFKTQFELLYEGNDKTCYIGRSEENKLLNRFKNITAYDENLITLVPTADCTPAHAFINAGFVDGYYVSKKYIATQGPIPKTVGDFWHMVWQENVQFIVMLTKLMENEKKKCARYWPEEVNKSEVFGSFTITLLEESSSCHIVTRKLEVTLHTIFEATKIVSHYQYISWPDYGVPDSASPLLSLTSQVTDSWSQDRGPIVVHCSAGVGRTGSFIAIDIGMEQIKREGKVDIAGIVTRLRQQRMKMVQTSFQYSFVYDAVLEISIEGTNEVCPHVIGSSFEKWKNFKDKTGKTVLEKQFEVLNYVTPQHDQVERQTAEQFPEKNRSTMYLPFEKWRVPLRHVYPDYIHATFVHGYSNHKAFIIAQSPMDTTVKDFWKMIMDYKVSAIAMCCNELETTESLYQKRSEISQFVVQANSKFESDGLMKREINIIDAGSNISFQVTQFQINNWSRDGVKRNAVTILKVIQDVVKLRRTTGGGPVVVLCSDTVGCSGVFCAASNAIEQCQFEGHVSIFQAVKAVRMHKPQAVNCLNHYETVFEVVLKYLQQNSTYSNFI